MTASCLCRAGRMRRSKYFIYNTLLLERRNRRVKPKQRCDEQGVYSGKRKTLERLGGKKEIIRKEENAGERRGTKWRGEDVSRILRLAKPTTMLSLERAISRFPSLPSLKSSQQIERLSRSFSIIACSYRGRAVLSIVGIGNIKFEREFLFKFLLCRTTINKSKRNISQLVITILNDQTNQK